jgi:tricorn protease
MGPIGYAEFHRYFMSEVDRDGLIIDVRFNGGGHVSQLLLEKLLRRRVGYDANRWGQPEPYPADAPMGPMVALTNEYAGSDGDIFSHCFKLYGLGPLIGKRTWGGVVGIWPRHFLVDGTVTTQPEFAFHFDDVGWGVENYGTDPDIEVDIRPQDHAAGRDPQMERAISEVEKLMRRQRPHRPEFRRRPALRTAKLDDNG